MTTCADVRARLADLRESGLDAEAAKLVDQTARRLHAIEKMNRSRTEKDGSCAWEWERQKGAALERRVGRERRRFRIGLLLLTLVAVGAGVAVWHVF